MVPPLGSVTVPRREVLAWPTAAVLMNSTRQTTAIGTTTRCPQRDLLTQTPRLVERIVKPPVSTNFSEMIGPQTLLEFGKANQEGRGCQGGFSTRIFPEP